jgi:hypothetical protein
MIAMLFVSRESVLRFGMKVKGKERETNALQALAAKKDFIIWKSWRCSWPIMTAGEYTPAAVKAAPKRAPDAIERKVLVSMLSITFVDELKLD